MPWIKPVLNSVDAIWPLCGDFVYTFYTDPSSGDLVKAVIPNEGDNSVPLKITVQTNDYTVACNTNPCADEYSRAYDFSVGVHFLNTETFFNERNSDHIKQGQSELPMLLPYE